MFCCGGAVGEAPSREGVAAGEEAGVLGGPWAQDTGQIQHLNSAPC